jgi:hypothetical protein
VIDGNVENEVMVTVIATGFNRRGSSPSAARMPRVAKSVEKIPSGASELQRYDEPAYVRRGVDIPIAHYRTEQEGNREKIDKSDPEKPAFLRKIMD